MSNCISCNIDSTPLPKSGKDCGIVNEDPLYNSGNCTLDENGNPIVTPTVTVTVGSCVPLPSGQLCPAIDQCSPWDLTLGPENCLISNLVAESIEISGAPMNVYRLLGIHEQGSLQDLTGAGKAISSGDMPNFPASNAFDKFNTEWRSLQTGTDVIKHAFIGYDFGPIKLDNGRNRYGIETAIKHDVVMLKFKQGCDASNRSTKFRLERSNDGEKWYGVNIFQVPDCDGLVTIQAKRTVPSRYWRLRPVDFNGSADDYWSVKAVQFIDYEETSISNIQDRILLENRDRDYKTTPDRLKGVYQPVDTIGNQTPFGFFSQEEKYVIEVSFVKTIQILGRPIIIGDIIELPSEMRYSANLTPVLKYFEVLDVDWSASSYTPSWVPTLLKIVLVPALASQETQKIFGSLVPKIDESGLSNIDDGNPKKYQDYADITHTIRADANTMVPQNGTDYADVQKLSKELVEYGKLHPELNIKKLDRYTGVYGQDAMPPNGEPYTEGDEFPKNPKNGDWHRKTFSFIQKNIPPRLHRYSSKKKRWIFMESDARFAMTNSKELLDEFKNPENSTVTDPTKFLK